MKSATLDRKTEVLEALESWVLGINLIGNNNWKICEVATNEKEILDYVDVESEIGRVFRIRYVIYNDKIEITSYGYALNNNPYQISEIKNYISGGSYSRYNRKSEYLWDINVRVDTIAEMIKILTILEAYVTDDFK